MDKELILHPNLVSIIIGVSLGFICSILHYQLVKLSIKSSINNSKATLVTLTLFILKPIVLICPMLFGAFVPKYVSAFGVFAGMLLQKLILLIGAFFKKNGGE